MKKIFFYVFLVLFVFNTYGASANSDTFTVRVRNQSGHSVNVRFENCNVGGCMPNIKLGNTAIYEGDRFALVKKRSAIVVVNSNKRLDIGTPLKGSVVEVVISKNGIPTLQ